MPFESNAYTAESLPLEVWAEIFQLLETLLWERHF